MLVWTSGLKCFCAARRIIIFIRSIRGWKLISGGWLLYSKLFAVCVLELLLWQRPRRTAGCSPCGGAQGSLSQQDLVTSKDWGKGKHSAEVPLSAGLQAHTQTHTQKADRTHAPASTIPPQKIWLLSLASLGLDLLRPLNENPTNALGDTDLAEQRNITAPVAQTDKHSS